MNFDEIVEELQTLLTEKNINFLIGSGASVPFFPTLGNIEKILTEREYSESVRQLIYLHYFNEILSKNLDLIDEVIECEYNVTNNYRRFIRGLVNIMNYRNSRISTKRANIFTTNYDIFFERAIDFEQRNNSSIVLNDGGNGYFLRTLSSENYHKTVSRNGVFDNYQKELPTINLIKCHGSVNWNKSLIENQEIIEIQNSFKLLRSVQEYAKKIELIDEDKDVIRQYLSDELSEEIELKIQEIAESNYFDLENFFNEYKKLMIINPEKSKFKNTVMDEYYYSMLRLLSYELEKDQTILIVFGFSFADEHIRNLIKRSIQHNPNLRVYIFAYKNGQGKEFMNLLNCGNQKNIITLEPKENMPPIDFYQFNRILFEDVD